MTGLVVLLALLPLSGLGWALTTRRPERDDERWFEHVVRGRVFETRERLRDSSVLGPLINVFSTRPRGSCVVYTSPRPTTVDPP